MFFTNLALLGGLTALAVPILLHLLLKRKKQRLRFSTLQFFQKTEQATGRRKFRHWSLLAARILLLTLIILAFARPYLPNQLTDVVLQKQHLVVFVLDRSASMQADDGNGVRWKRAKESIQKVLSELKHEDHAALIGCSTHTDILSPLAPPETVTRTLKNLSPDFGQSDLGEGLQQAARILSGRTSSASSTIYVVSDLQRSACRKLNVPVPQAIEVKFLNIAAPFTPNAGITDLQLERSNSSRPHAVIANLSDENTKVRVSLRVDGQEVFTRNAELKPDDSTQVELTIPSLVPGWHETEVRIKSDDALALDNTRYGIIFNTRPTRVLVVEPRQNKRVFEEETFFIMSALGSAKDGIQSGRPHFAVDKIAAGDLVKKLSLSKNDSSYDFIIFPGLRDIPSGASKALAGFAQAGGGVLFFLGEGVSANRYNSEFNGLLPARLGQVEESLLTWRMEDYDKGSAIFAPFQKPNSGDLTLSEFTSRFAWTTNSNARVLAHFDDGMPFIVESTTAKIIMVNTSTDTGWNDWPKHKTFVPWLHSLGSYLAGNTMEQMKNPSNFTAGDDLDLDMGISAKKSSFRVQRTGGDEFTATADDEGHLFDLNFGTPGVYSIRNQLGQEVQRVAVNLAPEESDLSAMTTNQFAKQLVRTSETDQPALAAGLFGNDDNQKEFWRVLLIAGLFLMVLELMLANRTFA